MEAIAKRKNLKGSPQKTRLVIDLIRGRNVAQALAILQFTNKRAAAPVAKLLRSAIANATYKAEQENIAIDPDDLWVKKCFVDMGMHKNRRRLRPAPQGRAYQEQRHYCHITIELTSEQPESPVVKLKKHGNKVDTEAAAAREANKEKRKAKGKSKAEEKPAKIDKAETPEVVEEVTPDAVETVDDPKTDTKTEETVETVETEAAVSEEQSEAPTKDEPAAESAETEQPEIAVAEGVEEKIEESSDEPEPEADGEPKAK